MAQKEAIEEEIKRTIKLIGDRTDISKLEQVTCLQLLLHTRSS